MRCEKARGLLGSPILVATALLIGALPASAQPAPDPARRRELLERAVVARDADDHRTALTLFLEAGEIQMRPGLRMSIAQEQQALGLVEDACRSASRCIEELGAGPGDSDPRVQQGCTSIARAACRPPEPARTPSVGRAGAEGTAAATSGLRSVSTGAPRVHATPHPHEDGPARAQPVAASSRWWLWTGLSVLVVGGLLGGLAAGGVFERQGPVVGGTAYTVEALSGRW